MESSSIATDAKGASAAGDDVVLRHHGAAQCLGQFVPVVGPGDPDPGPDHFAQRSHLTRLEVRVHLGRCRTEPGRTDNGGDGQRTTPGDDRDVVPRPHSRHLQGHSAAPSQGVELGVA